tara:strand:- start:2753 stop:3391 length:639 start_codon:yes stop_codon:yes gene_type:complete
MNDLKNNFIEFAIKEKLLRFGDFTLKSGRNSPYYFNTGLCNSGSKLRSLADFYANYIHQNELNFDFIFGPAYKGITLASSISLQLDNVFSIDKPFSSNRKEEKTHGDVGTLIGSPLSGKGLIVDDVISSGSSIKESINIIKKNNAEPISILVALDRMELGKSKSATSEIESENGIKVHSIINIDDVVDYLEKKEKDSDCFLRMKKYLDEFQR